MKKYLSLLSILFISYLSAQSGTNVMSGAAQQAMLDFGNKSYKKAQPLNVQGSHYFDKEFKSTKL